MQYTTDKSKQYRLWYKGWSRSRTFRRTSPKKKKKSNTRGTKPAYRKIQYYKRNNYSISDLQNICYATYTSSQLESLQVVPEPLESFCSNFLWTRTSDTLTNLLEDFLNKPHCNFNRLYGFNLTNAQFEIDIKWAKWYGFSRILTLTWKWNI